MEVQSPSPKTLTLDSTNLFLTSINSLSQQSPPNPSHSFSPIPSDFPQSKLIPKTRFIVDAFHHAGNYSVSYFLSHFHSDHYTGLTPNWSKGVVFCSDITARLLIEILKVPSQFVVALPLGELVLIDGGEVVLIDANHCPGAVQFLFKVPSANGKLVRYVHTGDFRFCDSMKLVPVLSEFIGSDAIYLDTTYCNPKFVFPLQEESVEYVVNVIERYGENCKDSSSDVLFLVATYVIGKEKILLEIARRCKVRIHVDGRKMKVLCILGYGDSGMFTEDESESNVHVVGWNVLGETWPYFRPNFVKMKEIMVARGYSKVVGFVPTGWTYEVKHNKFAVRAKDSLEIHLVPYSEHSNYDELREYVKFLKPKRVVPTVGLDVEKLDSKHANKLRKHFASLVDEMANKQEFLMGFHRGSNETDDNVRLDDHIIPHEGIDLEKDTNSSETKVIENMYLGFPMDSLSSLQESRSRDLTVLNDEETEKIIKELRECLPKWVTSDQMLDLINSSDRNIVEAVSNFYERETDFYEQVIESRIPGSDLQTSVLNESGSRFPLKPSLTKSSPHQSMVIPLSQNFKSSNTKRSIKSSSSPAKRKRSTPNKSNKKVKISSKQDSNGAKQSMITSFFKKDLPDVSLGGGVESVLEPCNKIKDSLPSDTVKSYRDEIDQFIQIINGNESSRSSAATVIEKAKGDVNMALEIYYGNLKGDFCDNEESLVGSGKLLHAQCNTKNDTSGQQKKAEHMADLSVQGISANITDGGYISLPPEKYNSVEHACWKEGQPAPYIHLARTFELVEGEKGKIRATFMLCNMFRSLVALSPDDVLPTVYLCTNKIAADHENMDLNIGGGLVTAALEETCGTKRTKIREMYNSLGDLGDVAQVCRQTQMLLATPSPLLVKDVFSALQKISVQTGTGSTVRKKNLIVNLMRSCREKEIKFLVRTLVRNLRIGATMRTVLPALAQAVAMNSSSNFHQKESVENIKGTLQRLSAAVVEAYDILPSLDLVVSSLMEKGIEFSSSTLSMVPGIPIKPMLAKITNGVPQALKLFQNKAFTCEYKYDGQRAQIHKLGDTSVSVFSRNGDETTSRFPDVVNIIKEACKPAAETFILDAEVVAVDRKNGCKLMSFQELSSRERGGKDIMITLDSIKVDICVFVFDMMFANGEQLLGVPLRQRRRYLKDLFHDEKLGYFEYAKEITVEVEESSLTSEATITKISTFLDEAFGSSCEGIMVKSLDIDSGYTPSKRSDTWLKVKRDYVEGLNDSLDLVPIGAWHGNGRKAGWYSPFLMACYNPDTEEFQSVCRVMSGFSDSFYTEMKEFFSGDLKLSRKPPYYRTSEVPDMWFSPKLVWEIRGADFTVSPVHQAAIGLVHPSRGISIRFPRFICSVSDRDPEECSTAADIAEMFHSQTRKMDVTAQD